MKFKFWMSLILGSILFGFVGPYLISEPSTETVLIGIICIGGFMFLVKKIFLDKVNWKSLIQKLFIFILIMFLCGACSKVPAGYRGIKIYLLGSSKGVESEELGVGRYWIGWNEELYLFPTFTQNYVWTKSKDEGSPNDESLTFQTMEGLGVGADVGISYAIKADAVSNIFQKYRKGVDEITDIYLRNMVRDAFNKASSTKPVESVYGKGKAALLEEVECIVKEQVEPIGIDIERIYFIGNLRLPKPVVKALNAKIEAIQRAQQKENELREAKAEAQKQIAEAEGKAGAILKVAKAEAKANKLLAQSITPALVKYESIKKWDGIMPRVAGQSGIFSLIDMDVK